MNYILGVTLSLLSQVIISIANVLDGKLSRVTFSSVWSLATINGIILIPAIPVLYFTLHPSILPTSQLLLLIPIACIEVFYQIPYYKALREADTSTVMTFFNLEKVLIPVLAYFVVGERLSLIQYFGFGIIVAGTLSISISKNTFRPTKALYYMAAVCVMLALSSVFQKEMLTGIEWNTFYFWLTCISAPLYLLFLLVGKHVRREVFSFFSKPLKKNYLPLIGQNVATWIAGAIGTVALSILPVTVDEALQSFHAVIVYFLAITGHKILDADMRETFSIKRTILYVLVGIGAVIVVFA